MKRVRIVSILFNMFMLGMTILFIIGMKTGSVWMNDVTLAGVILVISIGGAVGFMRYVVRREPIEQPRLLSQWLLKINIRSPNDVEHRLRQYRIVAIIPIVLLIVIMLYILLH